MNFRNFRIQFFALNREKLWIYSFKNNLVKLSVSNEIFVRQYSCILIIYSILIHISWEIYFHSKGIQSGYIEIIHSRMTNNILEGRKRVQLSVIVLRGRHFKQVHNSGGLYENWCDGYIFSYIFSCIVLNVP